MKKRVSVSQMAARCPWSGWLAFRLSGASPEAAAGNVTRVTVQEQDMKLTMGLVVGDSEAQREKERRGVASGLSCKGARDRQVGMFYCLRGIAQLSCLLFSHAELCKTHPS